MKSKSRFLIAISVLACCNVYPESRHGALLMASEIQSISDSLTIPGAYGDGVHFDTKAIQNAIDSIAKLGGGIVRLAYGRYLSAPLTLRSNITLQIDSTAALLASQNVNDYYPPGTDTSKPATSLVNFISSLNSNNISIVGPGTIDGQGQPWWDAENVAKAGGRDTLRPRLIQLEKAVHISVSNITLKNAPMFHLCPNTSYDVSIDHVTIQAPSTAPNTDGIDPGKCHHVRITNCTIDNGDDNIAVGASSTDPSWPNAASSDIIISHCTFLHGHGCSIGSITIGGVDSMLVDSCTFEGTDNGIRIKSDRGNGGNVRHLTYSNLTMTNVRYPIYLTEYYPSIPAQTDTAQPVSASSKTPSFHDITITNVTSSNAASNATAGVVVGLPESKMINVHLNNVSISAGTGMEVRHAAVDTINTWIAVTFGAPYILEVNGSVTGDTPVDVGERESFPERYQLSQNYPNPFNPSTTISYSLPKTSNVSLRIFNTLGQEIASLVNEHEEAGNYQVRWNANVPSGVYFYCLRVGDASTGLRSEPQAKGSARGFVETKKMILLR